MKFIRTFLPIFAMTMLLSACAISPKYPQRGEDQAIYHVAEAQDALSKSEIMRFGTEIDAALNKPTGDALAKGLFAKNPSARDTYLIYQSDDIERVSTIGMANLMYSNVGTAQTATVLSVADAQLLLKRLSAKITAGNLNGSIPITLSDEIENFPALKSPEHQYVILNKSIKDLQGKSDRTGKVAALMNYAKINGKNSNQGKIIAKNLSSMNIKAIEIDYVGQVFPEFAKSRREEISTTAFVEVKGGDRLFADDLRNDIKIKSPGVQWVTLDQPRNVSVTIERLRHDERQLPERSETITYAQHEVNLLSAALLMPKNASYIYEIVSGGAEIDYGYAVLATQQGKPIFDQVVRGKVGGESRKCKNAKIQNVFGGVSSARFIANDDMQRRCNGAEAVSMDNLRTDVYKKIIESVLNIPPIKSTIELNR